MSSLLRRGALLATLLLCACALSACGGADARRASHMARGEKYLADGNLTKAQIEFRNALQISPNNIDARLMAGKVAERLGNLRDAVGHYQAAVEAAPTDPRPRANLGRLFVLGRLPDKALETIQPVMAQHPDDPDLLAVRGAVEATKGDRAAALSDTEHAVRVAPQNEVAVALLASLYLQDGQSQRAVDLLKATIERVPTSVDLHQILASLYEKTDQVDLAEAQFQEIRKLHPDDLTYRYQLAVFYTRHKRIDDADKVLREAIASKPDDDRAKLTYAEFVAQTRSPEDGERVLTDFLKGSPKDYDLQLALGLAQLRAKHPDAAMATYRALIADADLKPQALSARARLAALLVERGKLDEAGKLVGEALDKNPRDADALAVRASIALAHNDATGAIADYRAVLRDRPRAEAVLRDLARAYVANSQPALAEESLHTAIESAPNDAGPRIELSQLLVSTNRLDDAVKLLEEAVQSIPADVPLRETLTRAYLAKQNFTAAAKSAEDLKTLAPQRSIGFYLAGLVAQAQKQPDKAIAQFDQALSLQSDAIDVLSSLARLEVVQGRTADAITRVSAVVAKQPSNAAAIDLLGDLYLTQKDTPLALEQLTRAIHVAPKWWPGYRNLGAVQVSTGDIAGATKTFEQGIAVVGDVPALATDLASLYERQGRIDDAIRTYEGLHQKDPHSQLAANNLAMLLITYKTDRASLDRARDLTSGFSDSSNPALIDTEGWVHFKRGEVTPALTSLEKAVARVPGSSVFRYHLGMAQFKAGQRDKARENLSTAVGGTQTFTGLDEAKSVLAQLNAKTG